MLTKIAYATIILVSLTFAIINDSGETGNPVKICYNVSTEGSKDLWLVILIRFITF